MFLTNSAGGIVKFAAQEIEDHALLGSQMFAGSGTQPLNLAADTFELSVRVDGVLLAEL